MKRKPGSLIVGLDIGTSKVCAVVAAQRENGVEVIGLGTHPSDGLSKGVVVDVEKTVAAITKAIEEAEKMAQVNIRSAYISVANANVKGFTSQGMLPLRGRNVGIEEIERVVEAAESVAIPQDSEVLHVLPQEYILDNLNGIKDPSGMRGMRLEVNCYIVTIQSASVGNLVQCCHQSGLEIEDVILSPLASAEAVLNPEERELGVALIDLGGGTTDLVVFKNDAVKYTAVLSFGGLQVNNDLARCLHLTTAKAEWLKKRYGHCIPGEVMAGEEIEVESPDDGETVIVDHREVCEIIEARVAEILQFVNNEMLRKELDRHVSSVVLTGGTSHLRGIEDLAGSIFNRHVRVGQPRHVGGLVDVVASPMYAAGVGLVLLAAREQGMSRLAKAEAPLTGKVSRGVKNLLTKLIK